MQNEENAFCHNFIASGLISPVEDVSGAEAHSSGHSVTVMGGRIPGLDC